MSGQWLTIGELAHRTGLAPSALRYYEELGLLPPPPRTSGQRRYDRSAVERVGVILLLRDVGFTLAETKAFLASRSVAPDAWRRLARHKLDELEGRIQRATLARMALQHALRCTREDLLDCPNFAGVLAARLEGNPLEEAHTH
jgi:DNA-binding transcriptional MerR regulator